MNKQVLDKLDVERERGITVKAQTCTMIYKHKGEDYLLHLVDTPGHVDFRAEVSRSYASCGGALLLVDASQGVQAQTVANFYLAFAQGLELIPVINKVDLPSADPERALEQMKTSFELDTENAVKVSAKTGLNVAEVLPRVVEKIPAYVFRFHCVSKSTCTILTRSLDPLEMSPNPFACFSWTPGMTHTRVLFF
jgi:small GTP-binding protein